MRSGRGHAELLYGYAHYAAPLLPLVVFVPLLTLRVPRTHHWRRELAAMYQSLAIAQDGLASYTYLTPLENLSSVHLHSVLSAPLVALGYLEGGRLISLLAAAGTTTLVVYLGVRLWSRWAGLFAGLLFVSLPVTQRAAYGFVPEALSMLLTTGAIVAALRAVEDTGRRWYGISLVLLFVAPLTHLWEGIALVPVAVVYAEDGDWRAVTWSSLGGVLGVLSGYVGTLFQPKRASQLLKYAFFAGENYGLWFRLEWWFNYRPTPTVAGLLARPGLSLGFPRLTLWALTLPASVVALLWWALGGVRSGWDRRRALLFAWLLAGLSIPILLPWGRQNHPYYLWGLAVPLSLSLGHGVTVVTDGVNTVVGASERQMAEYAMAVLLLLFATTLASSLLIDEVSVGHVAAIEKETDPDQRRSPVGYHPQTNLSIDTSRTVGGDRYPGVIGSGTGGQTAGLRPIPGPFGPG